MVNKVGILYICTGKYSVFWEDFYLSSEKYFLKQRPFEKHYFVFTDEKFLVYENKKNVTKIYQEPLKWPFITLYRFKMFNSIKNKLESMDYLYFFNSNMIFVEYVGAEILPSKDQKYAFLNHPGFFNKKREEFTYETREESQAFINTDEGKSYFQGALNGGIANDYLNMSEQLDKNIDEDYRNGIIAIWHDESHLNRFAVDHYNEIKILDPSFGYPEGWNLPFKPKIIIRDKNKYGGHSFLRNNSSFLQKVKGWFKKWL